MIKQHVMREYSGSGGKVSRILNVETRWRPFYLRRRGKIPTWNQKAE